MQSAKNPTAKVRRSVKTRRWIRELTDLVEERDKIPKGMIKYAVSKSPSAIYACFRNSAYSQELFMLIYKMQNDYATSLKKN